MHTNTPQNKRRSMFRQSSSRGSLFPKIDEKISRTFSLSSSDCDDDLDNLNDGFNDEEIKNIDETTSLQSLSPNNGMLLPDLRIPLEKSHVQRKTSGFFMETMIRRDETKTRFVMYLQSTEGAHPIFCAQKYAGGQIIVKSIHDDEKYSSYNNGVNATILGSLVKNKKKKTTNNNKNSNLYTATTTTATTTTCYELMLHESVSTTELSLNNPCYQIPKKFPPLVVATIEYEQMSKARYLIEGSKPRRASVIILGRESMRAETRNPHQDSNGQKVLDFGGRGLETSSKNTQLVVSGNVNDPPCLQMVKWKDHEFNLDFNPPFNAFHAFAFALAQFDF